VLHPLANSEYSDYETHKVITRTLHKWPNQEVLEMNATKIDEYLEFYYMPEHHPFYSMVCTPFQPPLKYGTNAEESKKLFVDCFRDEVFSTAMMGLHPVGSLNNDIFIDKLLSTEDADSDEITFKYVTPLTLTKLSCKVRETFVTTGNILGWMIIHVLHSLKVPMNLFSSDITELNNTSGKKVKVPLHGLLWDQAPPRLIVVIHRIFLEYICRTKQEVNNACGIFAHDNFSKQKSHLLQVRIRIFVYKTYIYI
jgi:hypothetical protein